MDTLKNTTQCHAQGKSILHRMILLLVFGVLTISAMAQNHVRISGKVLNSDKTEELFAVTIVDLKTGRVIGQSSFGGSFNIVASKNSKLRFQSQGYKPVEYSVGSQDLTGIEILMEEEGLKLGEATVKGDAIKKSQPRQTKMGRKGKYLTPGTTISIQRDIYSSRYRYVGQPILLNLTKNTYQLMRPIVLDADEYHLTQDRLYDFNMKEKDPIGSNVRRRAELDDTASEKRYSFTWSDSVYSPDAKDLVKLLIIQAEENYMKILSRDTNCIAQGEVYPLRLLEYNLEGCNLTDPIFIPQKDEPQERDSEGAIHLQFEKGKTELDILDSLNRQELAKMERDMRSITSNPDATLRSITIMGTSSPDGPYSLNMNLAKGRMKSALDEIMKFFSPEEQRKIDRSSKARVATWEEVVDTLRRDSLNSEADQIEEIIRKHKDIDNQGRAIKGLPFYQKLLDEYLPKLRRVQYKLDYTIYRDLTDEEIKEQYKEDYKQLTLYEMYRLFSTETDEQQLEEYLTRALENYPAYFLAANQLAVLKIKKGQPDPELLKDYVDKKRYRGYRGQFTGKKIPHAIVVNHMIALLKTNQAEAADTLRQYLDPAQPETRMIRAISDAYMGYYEEAYPVLAETGVRNKIILLLAMEKNYDEALELAKTLPSEEAISHYILAICHRRKGNLSDVETELAKAIHMDPSLRAMAENDADLNNTRVIRGDDADKAFDAEIPDRPWKKLPQFP